MKKLTKITVAALAALMLAGCSNSSSNSNNSDNSSSTTKTSTSAKQSTSKETSSTKASSNPSSSSQENSQSQSSSSSQEASSESTSDEQKELDQASNNALIQQGAGAMRQNLSDKALVVTLSGKEDSSKKVSVAYSGDGNNYTASYYLEKHAYPVNDEALKDKTPYATLTKKTYSSEDEALEQIDYQNDQASGNLRRVDLGNNIQATVNSGAGQQYLHWNEGNWSLTMHGSPVAGEDPLKAAREAVALLERYRLPAPDKRGSGRFEATDAEGDLHQTLTWNKGNVVYEMKADTLNTLVLMAASLQ